jgi:4-amino-4-deoxy-L-arabinose transferase-like glycosyltransferase
VSRINPPWSETASRLGWLVVALGTAFRLRQYLADRSLWRDEAALVYNILHRGYGGFSRPLSFEQGSPPGFLYAEKAVTQVFGSSELALRAIPLLAAIAALVLAFVLVRRHLDQTAGLVALCLCAGSPWLVYYASEVKQYSVDVLMAELVVLAASQVWRTGYDRRSCAWLALAGAVAIPCSHAATFVLGTAGLVLAWPALRRRDTARIRRLAGVAVVWMLVWIPMYLAFDRRLDNDAFLRQFWANAFLPLPPTDHAGLSRWGTSIVTYYGMLSGNAGLTWVFAPLTIVGIVVLWQRQRGVLAMVLGPWLAVVVASSVQLYPATERLVLFLVPAVAVLVGVGTAEVARWLRVRSEMLGLAAIALVLILNSAVTLHRVIEPAQIEELRPLLGHLQAQIQPADAVYVMPTAVPTFDYYRDRLHLRGAAVVLGSAGFDDAAAIRRQIEPLRTHARIWLVTSAYWQSTGHITPPATQAFEQIGRRIEEYDATGSSVVLYQTDPTGAG